MRRLRGRARLVLRGVFVCVVLVVAHLAGGHVHGDLLVPAPVSEHAPGDEHHTSSAESCDGVRAPTGSDIAPTAIALEIPVRIFQLATFEAAFEDLPLSGGQPLFLLHAALLI